MLDTFQANFFSQIILSQYIVKLMQWKKRISEAVSRDEFRNRLTEVCGLKDDHDYYGMAEQTGCIYMECEYGH